MAPFKQLYLLDPKTWEIVKTTTYEELAEMLGIDTSQKGLSVKVCEKLASRLTVNGYIVAEK